MVYIRPKPIVQLPFIISVPYNRMYPNHFAHVSHLSPRKSLVEQLESFSNQNFLAQSFRYLIFKQIISAVSCFKPFANIAYPINWLKLTKGAKMIVRIEII